MPKAATSTRTPTKKAGAAAAAPAPTKTSAGAAAAAPADVAPEYRPDLPIGNLVKHPNNPRHRAVADDEMVESVRIHGVLEPVVVADLVSGGLAHGGKFVIIAGHRRLDASKKAGRKTLPVLIRRDLVTEAQQLEAMLIENLHRKDLTPIEEAEGYHQLELFGYRQHAIAKAMGVSPSTVRDRLKLLKLSSTTIKKVQAGDLTLTDATQLVDFADDPETTKDLEKAAKGEPHQFKRALTEARRIRDMRQKVAVEVAKLLDRGAIEVQVPAGNSVYNVTTEKIVQIGQTHSDNWDKHKGCLGFCRYESTWSGPQLHILCVDAPKHAKAIAAEQARNQDANDRQWEEQRRAREEASLKRSVAADMRLDTIAESVADVVVPSSPFTDVVRYLLPILLHELDEYGDDGRRPAYQRLMGIKDEDRWGRVRYSDARKIDKTRFRQHVDELRASPALAMRALVAHLAVTADAKLGKEHSTDHTLQLEYLQLLDGLGHAGDPEIDGELRQVHLDKGGSTS